MDSRIHPTAIVHPDAEIGENVTIGPYAVIEQATRIGAGTRIDAAAQIKRYTTLGRDNHVHSMANVGDEPQDLKFAGEKTTLVIGDRNKIREFSTIHRGTEGGGGVTRIGSDCLMMAYSHIAHDCILGDRCILANAATLAGHVELGDEIVVGGLSAVHQFVHIGSHAFIGGKTGVAQDVPPYMLTTGERAVLRGLNLVGLRRLGLKSSEIGDLKKAYKLLWRSGRERGEVLAEIEETLSHDPRVMEVVAFIKASTRGTITPE